MIEKTQNEIMLERVKAIVDTRLFAAFRDGASHFGTRDLVLLFDEGDPSDPLSIVPRMSMVDAQNLPDSVKDKVREPARSVAKQLTDSDTAFWLIVMFADGEACCVAINAKPIAPGGNA